MCSITATGIDVVLHEGSRARSTTWAPAPRRPISTWRTSFSKLLGKPDSLIQHVTDRPGHDRRYALNCDKCCSLGLALRHTFEQALEKTVRWYVDNEWWWRKIKSGAHYREYYARQYGDRLQA